jgi:hypothetical protein
MTVISERILLKIPNFNREQAGSVQAPLIEHECCLASFPSCRQSDDEIGQLRGIDRGYNPADLLKNLWHIPDQKDRVRPRE